MQSAVRGHQKLIPTSGSLGCRVPPSLSSNSNTPGTENWQKRECRPGAPGRAASALIIPSADTGWEGWGGARVGME